MDAMRGPRSVLTLLLGGVVAVVLSLIHPVAAQAIANGESVADGKYPFAVKLTMAGIPDADGSERDSSCSGGLISPRWVLTAGHCFRDANLRRVSRPVAEKTTATVGRANLTSADGQQATVVAVRQSDTTDIALAKLDRPITGVVPMKLSRNAPRSGERVRLLGYGLTSGTATKEPKRLRTGEFTVTAVAKTTLGLAGTEPRADTSACPHDSGGPYFTQKTGSPAVVVAVVSKGPTCPHTGADLGGRVDTAASWIQSIIGADLKASSSPSAKPQPSKSTQPDAAAHPDGGAQPDGGAAQSHSALPPSSVPLPDKQVAMVGGAVAAVGTAVMAVAVRRRPKRRRGRHR